MNMDNTLRSLLDDFWKWANITAKEYSCLVNASEIVEPFYFPQFEVLRLQCLRRINLDMNASDLDDFLTCVALDEEEEVILDWCKDMAEDAFVARLAHAGCYHLQPGARWQIAELLRCRKISQSFDILQVLDADPNAYVRKRAQNTYQYLQNIGR